LDKFYSYFSEELAKNLEEILKISKKYEQREKTITGLEGKTVDNIIFYFNNQNFIYLFRILNNLHHVFYKNKQLEQQFKVSCSNIETINNLKKELDENSKNAINFQANRKNYEEKIKEIC